MNRQIVSTNIRFNLEKKVDRAAWEYLQQRDKRQCHSYSKAVIAAVNDYFERRGRLDADPYLETRKKEDAFLLRVLETIRAGFNHAAPVNPDFMFLATNRKAIIIARPMGRAIMPGRAIRTSTPAIR
ncbi:hypothetical protein N510_000694 [Firmicutes bacterium ASF500]|nr:hypothetical protein N510_000694 [Firmicutes bacterium ASF500]